MQPQNPRVMHLANRLLVAVVLAAMLLLTLFWPAPAWGMAPEAVGARLFENHCAGCHLHGGNIIRRGRTLKRTALERQGISGPGAIAEIASAGIGQMGGYGEVLGNGGAEAVAAYVWQQALADWQG